MAKKTKFVCVITMKDGSEITKEEQYDWNLSEYSVESFNLLSFSGQTFFAVKDIIGTNHIIRIANIESVRKFEEEIIEEEAENNND